MPLPNNRPHKSLSRAPRKPARNNNMPSQMQAPEQYYQQPPVQQMPPQQPVQMPPYQNMQSQYVNNNYQNQPPVQDDYYEQPPVQNQPSSKRRRNANNNDDMNVPVYDLSNGYPKGLPNGIEAVRVIGGKRKKIHGVPYEALTEDIQEDLDEHPLDDAGQLRVFIKDRFYGEGHYIELGSEQHANKFMGALREQGKRLL